VLDLRPGSGWGALPRGSDEERIGRDLHQALVTALRDRGHLPSSLEAVPDMRVAGDPPTLAAILPRSAFAPGLHAALLVGLGHSSRAQIEGKEVWELGATLALYQASDGQRVWTRDETFRRAYASPATLEDLCDDLVDAWFQRAVPKEGEEGPLPVLHGLPPAQAPTPPPPGASEGR
jgi:hypothetical protein